MPGVVAFRASLGPLLCIHFLDSHRWITQLSFDNFVIKLAILALVTLLMEYWLNRGNSFKMQIVYRALLLGSTVTFGLHLTGYQEPWWPPFGCYLAILATFHLSEFLSIAYTNPKEVQIDRFLLNHSREYHLAFLISVAEFAVTSFLFPEVKFGSSLSPWLFRLGLILCIGGEVLRKLAIFTAGSNFDHIIQTEHSEHHKLVTSGVYGLCRHPSYVGWFFWSIGTQLVLLNPISLFGYTYFSWHFFDDRIRYEEATLLRFFGPQYELYKQLVPSGLPFIRGFDLKSYQ